MSMHAFEAAVDARNQFIHDTVGIAPDTRTKIPRAESMGYILGVQAGEPVAAERLIATKLIWLYESFVPGAETLEDRPPEAAEVLQIGAVATLEAAKVLNLGTKEPLAVLAGTTRQRIEIKMRPKPEEPTAAADLAHYIDTNPLQRSQIGNPEAWSRQHDIEQGIATGLAIVPPRQRDALRAHYGFDNPPMTLRETGKQMGITAETARAMIEKSHEKIRRFEWEACREFRSAGMREVQGDEAEINEGLGVRVPAIMMGSFDYDMHQPWWSRDE